MEKQAFAMNRSILLALVVAAAVVAVVAEVEETRLHTILTRTPPITVCPDGHKCPPKRKS